MSGVTRRALRVYAALSELKNNQGDVLDALIPFFDPILELMNDRIFNPAVFATGVQKLYRWRFNKDIAEQFIPRLEQKGFLERRGRGAQAVFVVRFKPAPIGDALPINTILNRIVDEFESFPPKVTGLFTYSRTREQLTDNLIRFLVSMDAYDEAGFAREIQRLQLDLDVENLLKGIEEGGPKLADEDKYMCARFVQHICKERPEFVPHLARLASIGLLTEVVEDFIKPVQQETKTNLVVAVDAPLALDFLGCSGLTIQNDVRSIFDALKGIGCSFIAFPATCEEITRNLTSMLTKSPEQRHGPTHSAIQKNEVELEFVRAVAGDPESALKHVGITVRPITLEALPGQKKYFDHDRYQDFFECVNWVPDLAPREHDATCMALTMRLRAGHNSSDIFKSGHVLVTRNPRFAQESRSYCLKSRLISPLQQGPVVHQRQLATVAWLRTGLGADDAIPRSHLMATCDRVLRVRMEVRDAVAAKLKQVTPEKLPQFELLLQDHRGIRRLADETLNDAEVVTTENAGKLLEAMRKATAEEERQTFEATLKDERARHKEAQKKSKAAELDAKAKLEQSENALADLHAKDRRRMRGLVLKLSRFARGLELLITAGLIIAAGLAIFDFFTDTLKPIAPWKIVLALGGVYGLYSLIMTMLERPRRGLTTVLNFISKFVLQRRLESLHLSAQYPITSFEFSSGKITYHEPSELMVSDK